MVNSFYFYIYTCCLYFLHLFVFLVIYIAFHLIVIIRNKKNIFDIYIALVSEIVTREKQKYYGDYFVKIINQNRLTDDELLLPSFYSFSIFFSFLNHHYIQRLEKVGKLTPLSVAIAVS